MAEKLNLKQKLVEIRKTIGVLQKTESGNQGAKYVDPGVILLKIREAMDKLSVLLTVEVTSYSNKQVQAPTKNNPNNIDFLSETTMVYTWHDADSEETISCPWHSVGSHSQDPSMSFGGGLTFSERYFMLKFFQIPTSKDDPESLKAKAGVIECVSETQIADIEALISETKTDREKFLNHFGVKDIKEIFAGNYNNVVGQLEAKR